MVRLVPPMRRDCSELLAHKLQVKLFLRHPFHAKLYLIYRGMIRVSWSSGLKIDLYGLWGKVVPIRRVVQELPNVPARFRLVLIDERHNLRNKEGRRYQATCDSCWHLSKVQSRKN